jgi:hypothetical protein
MSDDESKLSGRIHDSLLRHVVEMIERLTERVVAGETETQKKMDFILDQQAQLTTNVGLLADTQTRAERRWEITEGSVRNLLAVAEIQSGEIHELGEAVRVINQRQREADERRREADERGRQTDERLNAFINTVERIISERKNGNS